MLARFHFALRQNGALVLGRSERIPFAARRSGPRHAGGHLVLSALARLDREAA